jgi:hypothetical protein
MAVKLARVFLSLLLLSAFVVPAKASEQDALSISDVIGQRHMPHGVIVAPVFASASSDRIVAYSRGADAAIWTGHYLAAESFRYKVTGELEALENARAALRGISSLRRVTGTNLLARCLFPTDWTFASSIRHEEAGHGIYTRNLDGRAYNWVGNTSRDQYMGVFFGLAIAFDLIDEADVRQIIREEVTALLEFLLDHDWAIVMPDLRISTVFWARTDQQLGLLQVGRHVNPGRFAAAYDEHRARYSSSVAVPVSFEVLDTHGSYFKFNINAIGFYNLVRLEDSSKHRKRYLKAYKILRKATRNHGNAHFNMIDRALKGADSARDGETLRLLDKWLMRPRRDQRVDLRNKYPACSSGRACSPVPVEERVTTDFLWQRSPFQLSGGGSGTIETPGIDYILPYWMARYFELL